MLCNELRLDLTGKNTQIRRCLSIEQKVSFTLDILANAKTFYQAGKNVRVSESFARIRFYQTLESMKNNSEKFMRFPVGEELYQAIQEWERKYGIPGIVEAIDGSHITIE